METMFKVIAKDSRTGVSARTGSPYVIENLTLNFRGKAAKIRAPRDMTVNIGDSVRLELGTVRGFWCRSDRCSCERSNSARKERRMTHEY